MIARKRASIVGEPASSGQREALDRLFAELPDHDPYHARALVDLHDPGTGAVHEFDAILIGDSAIYLLEVREDAGLLEGDEFTWRTTSPDGAVRHHQHPLRALRGKQRVFTNHLTSAALRQGLLGAGQPLPAIQPLVFLAGEDVELRLTPVGRACVVQRSELAAALRQHEFPGAQQLAPRDRITSIRGQALRTCLDTLALRPRQARPQAGAHELGITLADGRGFQDREAHRRDTPELRRRARTYLIPEHADPTARLNLRRDADRDADLLWSVREHPEILRLHEFVADAPLGPTLILDAFEGSVSLRDFLARRPELLFIDRVAILEQVGLALAHCHRRVVHHGGLGPDAVLVRQLTPGLPPEVRLTNFQASRADLSSSAQRTRFASEPAAAFQAPELLSAVDVPGAASDLFSLGALGYFLFTAREPAESGVELQSRLAREGALDPRGVVDTVPDAIADAIVRATRMSPSDRGDGEHGPDLGAWLESIRASLGPRVEVTGFAPPLQAPDGARLRDDLVVVRGLGQGASARVLEVQRGEQRYALKVSLGPAQDDRLLREAHALQRLHHSNIVQLHEAPVLAGRQCLLLSLAGPRTLQQAIDQQGSIDLDRALDYGEQLLSALEHLEAEQLPHRDLKPANLGEGSLAKQARRLVLFDFSLAGADLDQVDLGTAAYRDPYLPLRGRWDFAADRWSAAVVLHEMLTGVRPRWKPRGTSPLASEATLVIASEAFDPAARDRLTRFFTAAFARELPDRFASATAMRAAWTSMVEAPPAIVTSAAPHLATETRRQALADLGDDAPLEALPLGVRARNVLDRAGLTRATDLLALPNNRLSAIRGAGSKVSAEILALRAEWLELRAAPVPAACFPNYRGPDLALDLTDLPTATSQALMNAGLDRLGAVAAAPADQLATLARRHGFDLAAVRRALQARDDDADAREHPTTSQAWIDALFAHAPHVQRWLGLVPPRTGTLLPTIAEAAAAASVSTAVVSRELTRVREQSLAHPAIAQLAALVTDSVDDLGGFAPLLRAAEALRARLGDAGDDPDALVRATALVRWIAELPDRERITGVRDHNLRIERLVAGRPDATAWVSRDPTHADLVRRLGETADRLAAQDILAAPAEAEAELRRIVDGSSLATLPQGRLLDLAALASQTAACSSRLELYRRDLAPERAILHTAPALGGEPTPEEVIQRVRARYPESADVPRRPGLDDLLAPLGLHWSGDRYRRRSDETRSSFNTLSRTIPRRPTAHPGQPPGSSAEAVQSREFEARLELALRGGEALALAITPRHADRAARELARVVQRPAVLLDQRLIAAIETRAAELEIEPAVIHETDRLGERSPFWHHLRRLAAEAAERLAAELFPAREPLLLSRPGLLARYELTDFLHRAVKGTRDPDAASLLLLIPCHRNHAIEDRLPVPGLAAAQRITIPEPWLVNAGRATTDHPCSTS